MTERRIEYHETADRRPIISLPLPGPSAYGYIWAAVLQPAGYWSVEAATDWSAWEAMTCVALILRGDDDG